ncbi:MAG: tetratricopeptide repeat protein [Clostridiales bacterium]|nr:tetratricopeptide repeat protein [Clostridiales bacterium]
MGFLDGLKARKALVEHQRGHEDTARETYEKLYADGYLSAAYMLPYSVLLLREGGEENYLRVKEILKKAEKAPDLDEGRRKQLLMNYAVAQYKLGEIEKAIHLLERTYQKGPSGLVYGALGFLYIQAGDAEKALAFNQEGLEYDDEDPVVLDNLGQTYYRLLNDKETARTYFEKALEFKDSQIDTLYFLSRYDLEEGKTEEAVQKLEKAAEGRFSPLNYVTKAQIEEELAKLKA